MGASSHLQCQGVKCIGSPLWGFICYWNLSSWVCHEQGSNHVQFVTVACDGPVASAMVHLNRQH
jgi:hypothetical protein